MDWMNGLPSEWVTKPSLMPAPGSAPPLAAGDWAAVYQIVGDFYGRIGDFESSAFAETASKLRRKCPSCAQCLTIDDSIAARRWSNCGAGTTECVKPVSISSVFDKICFAVAVEISRYWDCAALG